MSIFLEFRVVGGLLSAYDLSNDQVFLDKAKDIADRLLPAWDTPSGIPYNIINLAHGRPHNPGWTGVSCYFSYVGHTMSWSQTQDRFISQPLKLRSLVKLGNYLWT